MNIFEQYGIKEVADVTIYSIQKKTDGSGEIYYVPALYLDSLKISSTEKSAENVWAQGGLGNSRLICWDYGKQINITLQDALCTPASLGLCWGGILGSDWKDGKIEQDFGISYNKSSVEKISRMEKVFYPKSNRNKSTISLLLPQSEEDMEQTIASGIIMNSEIVDGTIVQGHGYSKGKTYTWKMRIESDIKSIAIIPNKFFDVNNCSYTIVQNAAIGVRMPSQSEEFKIEVIYKINGDTTRTSDIEENSIIDVSTKPVKETSIPEIKNAKFLKIRVDNDNNYTAYLGSDLNTFDSTPCDKVDTSLFKGIDMWLRFSSINEMIYFIITKYEDDIIKIGMADITGGKTVGSNFNVNEKDSLIAKEGKLWAYVSPKTLSPYDDDYWFMQGESYYIKSLTMAPTGKKLKAQSIKVKAGQFPGMYMIVGETYIRDRDTGKDERLQLKFPLCKILSNQNITLEAGGDPTTFDLNVEVATPPSGIMMELNSYEIAEKIIEENGVKEIKDGSTEVLSE